MKKRERRREREEREKKREREKRERGKLPARPPTEKPNVTIHPVASANYIMIFNGPKGKTWPPKIFGRGSWLRWVGIL